MLYMQETLFRRQHRQHRRENPLPRHWPKIRMSHNSVLLCIYVTKSTVSTTQNFEEERKSRSFKKKPCLHSKEALFRMQTSLVLNAKKMLSFCHQAFCWNRRYLPLPHNLLALPWHVSDIRMQGNPFNDEKTSKIRRYSSEPNILT